MLRQLPKSTLKNLSSKRLLSKAAIVPVSIQNDKLSSHNNFLSPNTLAKLTTAGKNLKSGQSRNLYNELEGYDILTVVNLERKPDKKASYNNRDEDNEFIRTAIGNSIKSLKGSNLDQIEFVNFEGLKSGSTHELVAEAATLVTHNYKSKEAKKFPKISFASLKNDNQSEKGKIYGDSQNLARDLMEAPANLMTPEIFAETIKNKVDEYNLEKSVQIIIRNKDWIESMKMKSFLSVSEGSEIPPVLLEIHVNRPVVDETNKEDDSDEINPIASPASKPEICFVGKGVTFDTGGISIKPSAGMDAMRADMGGAATMAAATLGAARLGCIDKHFSCIIPLCENMPSGAATKPGDVVVAMNGKSIQIDNTDAEGRLILADALTYADKNLQAVQIIDAATLTGAMMIALGSGASGVFSRSTEIFENLEKAGHQTGDRVWRMPLFSVYTEKIKKSPTADLNNIGGGRGGGACTAAAFLAEFVENENWAHVDIAGVMDASDAAYIGSGMSGRPTRTFVKYLEDQLRDEE